MNDRKTIARYDNKEDALKALHSLDFSNSLIPGTEGYEKATFEIAMWPTLPKIPELKADPIAIHKGIKEGRQRRTVKVKQHVLP